MMETVHGVLLIVGGVGVLITGDAAAGKSECALDLMTRGHRLVADDIVLIDRTGDALNGKAPDNFAGLLEVRDIGIFDVRQAFGKDSYAAGTRIDLCVELKKNEPAESEVTGSNAQRLFGMQLQNLTPDLTDALGYVQGRGVLVSAVEPDSPADRAGIQRGLVIYRVGRYNVSSIKQLEDLLARVEPGSSVDFTVGIVRANGQGQQVETVPLTAR